MATIYRVENKNGDGPYWSSRKNMGMDVETDIEMLTHNFDENTNKWPNLCHDKGLNRSSSIPNDGEFCGFISMAQLIRWFRPKLLDGLLKAGYSIVCIDGEIVAQSKKQVIFIRKDLVRVPDSGRITEVIDIDF